MYGIQLEAHAICDTRQSFEPHDQIYKSQSARPTPTPEFTTTSWATEACRWTRSTRLPIFTMDWTAWKDFPVLSRENYPGGKSAGAWS